MTIEEYYIKFTKTISFSIVIVVCVFILTAGSCSYMETVEENKLMKVAIENGFSPMEAFCGLNLTSSIETKQLFCPILAAGKTK